MCYRISKRAIQTSLDYFEKPQRVIFDGFYCHDVVAALKSAGANVEYKYLKLWLRPKIYSPGVIVLIARNDNYPVGHYLIRVKGGWMDSWINWPDIDSGAKAGLRKRLPGRPIYAISPT
jgi:hypothetical protein